MDNVAVGDGDIRMLLEDEAFKDDDEDDAGVNDEEEECGMLAERFD